MNDPTPAQIATLSPLCQEYAIAIINAFREAGVPLGIVANGARRNPATQSQLVSAGRSLTTQSAHLTGDAFDVDILGLSRDQIPKQFWDIYGQVIESLGLTWGGRFSNLYDPAHAELPKAYRSA
jgi:hypothetical protein